jgi:hypothetical protein
MTILLVWHEQPQDRFSPTIGGNDPLPFEDHLAHTPSFIPAGFALSLPASRLGMLNMWPPCR